MTDYAAADAVTVDGPLLGPGSGAERLVDAAADGDEGAFEAALRPRTLDEFIGQERVREQLAMLGDAGRDADSWLAERRERWIMGTPDEARERVAALEAAGVQRLMLQDFLPRDLDMVRLLGEISLS